MPNSVGEKSIIYISQQNVVVVVFVVVVIVSVAGVLAVVIGCV